MEEDQSRSAQVSLEIPTGHPSDTRAVGEEGSVS